MYMYSDLNIVLKVFVCSLLCLNVYLCLKVELMYTGVKSSRV